MKAVALSTAATALASVAALGQGQFVFNNRVLPDINARFVAPWDSGTSSSIGTDYTVLLFNGASPLDPSSTTFRGPAGTAAAGYVTPTTETVPGVPPGANANITVRVVGPCGASDFGPYSVIFGGGTITPPNLPLGTAPLTVYCLPELRTTALGLASVGVWLLLPRQRRTRPL
jgi:hypothetical protein